MTETRRAQMDMLGAQIKSCRNCKGMNIPEKTQAAPGFGSVRSPVAIVGQSLCGPCMAAQEPFYGGCGDILNEAFHRAGVAKKRLFVTNVVHCHPPNNRKSLPEEISRLIVDEEEPEDDALLGEPTHKHLGSSQKS